MPNPFETETTIGFRLPKEEQVSLDIYDVHGKLVRRLQGKYAAGYHTISVDRSMLGDVTGVFVYSLRAGNLIANKKMVVVK